jgi:hypothetical protein
VSRDSHERPAVCHPAIQPRSLDMSCHAGVDDSRHRVHRRVPSCRRHAVTHQASNGMVEDKRTRTTSISHSHRRAETRISVLGLHRRDMRCMRCQGLMVWDRFLDLAQTDPLWALAWRCVNCGEVLDAVIQSHRISARLLREPVQELQTTAMKSRGKQAKSFSPGAAHAIGKRTRKPFKSSRQRR